MCWSGEASAFVAAAGISTTAYAIYKKEHPALWAALGYFSMMELLQAYTYTVINQCNNPSNQVATLLGYLHIVMQPFFINALSMYFIPDEVRKKIQYPVYILCIVSLCVMIIQVYPFHWAGSCDVRRILCSAEQLCSVSGEWHIAWEIPLNGIGNYFMNSEYILLYPFRHGYITYGVVAFLLPVLYGSWRFSLFHFATGPIISQLLSDNVNEQPAIWCLVSFAILLMAIETPLRRSMHVRKWPLWRGLGLTSGNARGAA